MVKKVILALLVVSNIAYAQEKGGRGRERNPSLHEVSNKDIVQSIYPEATKVEKANEYWYRILNEKSQTIGFAMSSNDFCKDVMGYNNLTPIMVLVDKKKIIRKVALLSNWETPRFVHKLEVNGFFDQWVGKSLKEAKSVEVDGYTGATYTGEAVSKNIEFLLTTAAKKIPKS